VGIALLIVIGAGIGLFIFWRRRKQHKQKGPEGEAKGNLIGLEDYKVIACNN